MTKALRAALSASLSGAYVGVQLAVLSGLLEFQSFSKILAPSTADKAALSSAFIAGAVVGALPAGPVVDSYGRRRVLLGTAVVTTFATRAMAVTANFGTFLIARVICGIAFSFMNIATPMYLSEVAPTTLRGLFCSLYQLAITLGVFGIQLANWRAAVLAPLDSQSFRAPLVIAQVPSVLMLFCVYFLAPETPVWLESRGLTMQARASRLLLDAVRSAPTPVDLEDGVPIKGDDSVKLDDLGGDGDSDGDGKEPIMKSSLSASLSSEPTQSRAKSVLVAKDCQGFAHLVMDKTSRRSLLIAVGVQVGQQLTGINCVIFFAPTILAPIFASSRFSATGAFVSAACIGLVNVLATLLSFCIVERFGRVTILLTTAVPMSVSLACLASVSKIGLPTSVGLVVILVYIALFAVGWGMLFVYALSRPVLLVALRQYF